MEIIRDNGFIVRNACYVGAWSEWQGLPQLRFLEPYDVASYYTLRHTLSNMPSTGQSINIASYDALVVTDLSGRQPNINDTPPGVGYNALVKSKAYLPITTLIRRTAVADNLTQILQHHDTVGANGGACFFDGTPLLREFQFKSIFNSNHPDTVDLYHKAREQATRNLYASFSKRTKVNSGVILAELKESMGMLGKASTALLLTVREIKRGRLDRALSILSEYTGSSFTDRQVRKILSREHVNRKLRKTGSKPVSRKDHAASVWLELQFGWMPIVDDIYKLSKLIDENIRSSESDTTWFSFNGYSGTHSTSYSNVVFDEFYNFQKLYDLRFQHDISIRFAFTATAKMSSPIQDALNSVGLLNPASIAWEIVPFSFVLDWFVPVGDWIESFTAHAGLDIIEVSSSVKTESKFTSTRPSRDYGSYDFNHNTGNISLTGLRSKSGEPVTYHDQSFYRLRHGTNDSGDYQLPPFPALRINLSQILEPWKLLTSLALFKALTGKR